MSTASGNRELSTFFARNPVFTRVDLEAFLSNRGTNNPATQTALLAYHERRGHIVQLRRGLYASIPAGTDPKSWRANPYAIATNLSPDAVVAYHSALSFWGKAHSSRSTVTYLTSRGNGLSWKYQQSVFRPLKPARNLVKTNQEQFEVRTERQDGKIRVTSLERTFVDVLDRPRASGGWEEIWRSLESIEYLAINTVIEYALLLGNATTIAKAGFYIDRHRSSLHIEDAKIKPLRQYRPKAPHYLERSQQSGGTLIKEWNLIVPNSILERSWEELT